MNLLRKKRGDDSYKKSFHGPPKKSKGKAREQELFHQYQSKKYTQSYDSNQLHLRFKATRPTGDAKPGTGVSPKKMNVLHDGRRD